jgi:23S rRNA pseudouridine1911/1915/1917 synthase
MRARRWVATARDKDLRLDQFVRQQVPELTRGALRRVFATQPEAIRIDGYPAKRGHRLVPGEVVEIYEQALQCAPRPRPDLPLELVAVEPDFVVLNKPAGIHAHPLGPGEADTLAGRLIARFSECAAASVDLREGGLVHRLDRSTSGLQVAARTRESYERLRQLFGSGQVRKQYLALVSGHVDNPGSVTAEIEAVPGDARRVRLSRAESHTLACPTTHYRALLPLGPLTLLEATCTTGRRHQVRAHLASCGYPLVNDELYGGPIDDSGDGAFLHGWKLQWHRHHFVAALPPARYERLRVAARAVGLPTKDLLG